MDTYYNDYAETSAFEELFAAAFTLTTLWVVLILSVLSIISWWVMFKKAGEPGWGSLIPVYNIYLLYKIAFGSGWYFLLLLVPFVNFIVAIVMNVKLAKSFGHGGLFALGLILFNTIFLCILAFGKSTYLGPGGPARPSNIEYVHREDL